MRPLWQSVVEVVKRTASGAAKDDLMTHAAAVAFYSALSFAPLLVLLLWLVASLQPAWQHQLVGSISHLVGTRASDAVQLVISNAKQRPQLGHWAGILGLLVTLVGASTVFAQLQLAINRVWNLRAAPRNAVFSWLLTRMHALGLLLTLAFLLIVSLVASAAIAVFVRSDTVAWNGIDALAALLLFGLVFASIYKVLPDARIHWRDALLGGAFTAVLFAVGKFGISVYLSHSNVGGAYGPAGSVVVLLVWVYYSVVILLLGAELTQNVAEVRGVPIRPNLHARVVEPCDR
ncbi:MAG: YihY/virulence factor BrkB family protein [Frateuria sp.]|uniref:YihY/virulence factor BrkB family protein n=1 Tax=Frateuria sp. TaxID=2211372 RepID=UPI0017A9A2A6|nr:YihY/virulence factor BrkB family protein [Frateuria sp.]NUO73915.1 YihY/virulence factor BrkB family protein [Frateuria sp.]NUR21470.1 YihY/virulence factor BrkB family protein [Frateuria sp.]